MGLSDHPSRMAEDGHLKAEQVRHGEIVAEAGQILGVKVLQPEYEILITLYENGTASTGSLLSHSSWSNSAFYAALHMLLARKLVNAEDSEQDHREIIHSLPENVRQLFNERFTPLSKWFDLHLGASTEEAGFRINQFFRGIESDLKIRFFTPEYEFILLLYEYGRQSPSDISSLSKASPSTIYNIIRRLTKKDIIEFETDALDRRKKYYFLTEGSRVVLDQLHKGIRMFLSQQLGQN